MTDPRDDDGVCPHCGQSMARWGQSHEAALQQVFGALRNRFYESWRAHFPEGPDHEPRPIGPERGHANTVCAYILSSCRGDVSKAREMARAAAENMFHSDMLTSRGVPWRWASVAKDPGRLFRSAAGNPSRELRDQTQSELFDRRMARAEEEAAPPDVGRAALAALKRGG